MHGGRGAHRPGPERVVPVSTYRLQVRPGFGYDDAAAQAEYLSELGVSHAYVSPILQPTPGSAHGYDVVDHEVVNEEVGGRVEFRRFAKTLALYGLGIIVDVVPNHMATPTPSWLARPWWSLLRDGREAEFAHWFDVDWDAEDGHVLVPVLGSSVEDALAAGELRVARDGGWRSDEWVLRYHEHAWPVRPGTEQLPLPELVSAQVYRLCDWREGAARLNYRRFFDVSTLAAIRVEDPRVFDATHHTLFELLEEGLLDGFRIDHPDGLADPTGYLDRLGERSGDAWVVAEKILEGHEQLPGYWRCAGTTGYDALQRIGGLFVDKAAAGPLADLAAEVTGERVDHEAMVLAAKREVLDTVQAAEVNRLLRIIEHVLPWSDAASMRRCLEALLVSMDRYRAYLGGSVPPGAGDAEVVTAAEERALHLVPGSDHLNLRVVAQLARGGRLPEARSGSAAAQEEFVTRFQQTCGPVMAKGVEDTTFYRDTRLISLNEVGGDPDVAGFDPDEVHAYNVDRLRHWPTTMTTLSTHDTKRSEDVRARLAVLSELPDEWRSWLLRARRLAAPHRGDRLDAATEYFLWQTLVGAWPINSARLGAYATKAVREAKLHTGWSDPDEAYESDVQRFVTGVVRDRQLTDHVGQWVERTAGASRSNILGQKLLQLVSPGVPDVYQGCELVDLSLVDPDNRRRVDWHDRWARLARLNNGEAPRDLSDEKLLVTSRALQLRREKPGWFVGEHATYDVVPTTTPHAVAVGRGDGAGVQAVAVVSRLTERLGVRGFSGARGGGGGWGQAGVVLPAGDWDDLLTGRLVHSDGTGDKPCRLTRMLADLPVALLVRHGSLEADARA